MAMARIGRWLSEESVASSALVMRTSPLRPIGIMLRLRRWPNQFEEDARKGSMKLGKHHLGLTAGTIPLFT